MTFSWNIEVEKSFKKICALLPLWVGGLVGGGVGGGGNGRPLSSDNRMQFLDQKKCKKIFQQFQVSQSPPPVYTVTPVYES